MVIKSLIFDYFFVNVIYLSELLEMNASTIYTLLPLNLWKRYKSICDFQEMFLLLRKI